MPDVPDAPESRPSPPPSTKVVTKTRVNIPYILIGSLLAAIWAIGAAGSPTSDAAGFVGAWVGSLFWPALIAWGVKGRVGDWRAFSRLFFWLALVIPPVLQSFRAGR